MLSKNQMKLVRSLGQKKYRKALGQFLVQGEKNVVELLNSAIEVQHVFATTQFAEQYRSLLSHTPLVETDEQQLSKVSTLTSNNSVIAVATIPTPGEIVDTGLSIALDGVSDPGNLGTIIRVADWYGVKQIILSTNCADPYNPKTISATMGSFSRVELIFADLKATLNNSKRPSYGAFLEGKNVHQLTFPNNAILVMGSESHGISDNIKQAITTPITIPNFSQAESLNVAMATGIILDNFVRAT